MSTRRQYGRRAPSLPTLHTKPSSAANTQPKSAPAILQRTQDRVITANDAKDETPFDSDSTSDYLPSSDGSHATIDDRHGSDRDDEEGSDASNDVPFIELQDDTPPCRWTRFLSEHRVHLLTVIVALLSLALLHRGVADALPTGCPQIAVKELLSLTATISYPQSLYATLSVLPNATFSDIRRASLAARSTWHPDHSIRRVNDLFLVCGVSASGTKPFTPAAANAVYHAVQAAISVLSDPDLRQLYDQGLLGAADLATPPLGVYTGMRTDWWECVELRRTRASERRGGGSGDGSEDGGGAGGAGGNHRQAEKESVVPTAGEIWMRPSKEAIGIPWPDLEATKSRAWWKATRNSVDGTFHVSRAWKATWQAVWRPDLNWLQDGNWMRCWVKRMWLL